MSKKDREGHLARREIEALLMAGEAYVIAVIREAATTGVASDHALAASETQRRRTELLDQLERMPL